MVICDFTIFFVLASFIDRWVCLDVSSLFFQGELECECEVEMFLVQMQFLMRCNLREFVLSLLMQNYQFYTLFLGTIGCFLDYMLD
jgi:hypothetical protein